MVSDDDTLHLLRRALIDLKSEDSVGWLKTLATEVAELGGGGAVDCLLLALDDAIDLDDGGNPDRTLGGGVRKCELPVSDRFQ